MLSKFQFGVFIALCIGDALVLRAYVGPHQGGSSLGRRYPKLSFFTHVFGGLGSLAFGALAILAYAANYDTVGQVTAIGQGLAVIFFTGFFAFPLARHTLGFKGFNLVGYVGYTIGWIVSGFLAVAYPGPQTAFACFVLTHAYLTCRIFVYALRVGWQKLTGKRLSPDMNYSIATNIAAMIPLVIAWELKGFAAYVIITTVSLALHMLGISSPWHARYKPESPQEAEKPELLQPDLLLVAGTVTLDLLSEP